MTRSQVTWAAIISVVAAAASVRRARSHHRARPSAAWRALERADLDRYSDDDWDVVLRAAGLGHHIRP